MPSKYYRREKALMSKPDPKDPSNRSAAWLEMSPKWAMIETLLGGTASMREAGEVYLPVHPEESVENYDRRLNMATLFNMTELTLNSWVGKPFSEPMKLNDDVPAQILEFTDDIDLLGNDVSTFSRNWFREGLAKAVAHVLIEMPSLTEEERAGRTREDDLNDGRRPYWVFIKPENVIFMTSEIIDGKETLTHVRIAETLVERNGFLETFRERIRVLEPGTFQVWEKVKEKSRKAVWKMVENGETGLDIIPMVSFYSDRTGLMTGKPPAEDLAFLNVRHWQSTSDQANVLTVARFPMLAASGATDVTGKALAIGPKQLLTMKNENGRFYYVEHKGNAITSGRQDLEDLEQQMASYGAEFLRKRPGGETATARALDSAEATSPLQDATNRFVDAMQTALKITAMWLRLKEGGGSVDLVTDFEPSELESVDLDTLFKARVNGDVSREDFLTELKRRGVLGDDFDIAVNMLRVKKEEEEGVEDGKGGNKDASGQKAKSGAEGDE
jgi:hypothetical protein